MSSTFRPLLTVALAAGLLAAAGAAQAGPYNLLLSSRTDASAGADVFIASYDSFADFISSPPVVGGSFSGINVSPGYQATGLVYDGKYRLMLASRGDAGAGLDVFFASYDTLGDLIASPPVVGGSFSGINVSPGYQATGLAYDGKYRMLLSSRSDASGGADAFIVTYDSFADMIASPAVVGGAFSGIDVSPAYQATGLTYDGKYHLMLASRSDAAAGADIFMVTYDNFDDLIASPAVVGGSFSGINVSPAYRAYGLAYEPAAEPPPGGTAPEPGSLVLAIAGLGAMLAGVRRKGMAPSGAKAAS